MSEHLINLCLALNNVNNLPSSGFMGRGLDYWVERIQLLRQMYPEITMEQVGPILDPTTRYDQMAEWLFDGPSWSSMPNGVPYWMEVYERLNALSMGHNPPYPNEVKPIKYDPCEDKERFW